MQESDNILRIFEEAKLAIEKGDALKLKELSNQTVNTASRTQDPDNVAVAVIVYSIGKILEREQYKSLPGWKRFYRRVLLLIDSTISSIKKKDEMRVSENLKSIRGEVSKLAGKLKSYIQDVFRKASINKASRIYEHGVSMEQTAKLLGITMYELAGYAGQRKTSEAPESITLSAKQRIKLAMEMFG